MILPPATLPLWLHWIHKFWLRNLSLHLHEFHSWGRLPVWSPYRSELHTNYLCKRLKIQQGLMIIKTIMTAIGPKIA